MWLWILIDLGDDSEEPFNLWAVNPRRTQVPSCTLTGRPETSPGYWRHQLTPAAMETPSPSSVLPTGSGGTGCCAFHLQGEKSPGASQGQLLASFLVSGFSFNIHTTESTSVLTDQICKDLLWLTLIFHWTSGSKHFAGWDDISSKVQPRFLLSFKHVLLLSRGSPTLWLGDIHPSCLWYPYDSPMLLYRAPLPILNVKDRTTAQCTYSSKLFNAGILLVNPNGAEIQPIVCCCILQSFYRCWRCDEVKCLIDNSAFG